VIEMVTAQSATPEQQNSYWFLPKNNLLEQQHDCRIPNRDGFFPGALVSRKLLKNR
jgi:hypothetical protein